jgi:hypothetical protein
VTARYTSLGTDRIVAGVKGFVCSIYSLAFRAPASLELSLPRPSVGLETTVTAAFSWERTTTNTILQRMSSSERKMNLCIAFWVWSCFGSLRTFWWSRLATRSSSVQVNGRDFCSCPPFDLLAAIYKSARSFSSRKSNRLCLVLYCRNPSHGRSVCLSSDIEIPRIMVVPVQKRRGRCINGAAGE